MKPLGANRRRKSCKFAANRGTRVPGRVFAGERGQTDDREHCGILDLTSREYREIGFVRHGSVERRLAVGFEIDAGNVIV